MEKTLNTVSEKSDTVEISRETLVSIMNFILAVSDEAAYTHWATNGRHGFPEDSSMVKEIVEEISNILEISNVE